MAENGRNERCPRCQKKFKDCRGHVTRRGYLGAFAAAVAVLVIIYFISRTANTDAVSGAASGKISPEVDAFFAEKGSDEWWLASSPQLDFEQEAFMQGSQDIRKTILRIIDRHQHTSPLAQRIAERFRSLNITAFDHGVSVAINPSHTANPFDSSDLEICFVPFDQSESHESDLYYFAPWRALMISGLTWPEKPFAGFIMHELGHALYHAEGRASATADKLSPSYNEEEVEMHLLEADVLNAETSGAYYRTLDTIIARAQAQNVSTVLEYLNKKDLQDLDALFQTEKSGRRIASVLIAEHELALGFRYIDQSEKPENRFSKKVAYYDWLRRTTSNQ